MQVTTGTSHPKRWWQRAPILPLARLFVVLVCLSLVLTDAWMILKAREQRLLSAQVETSNLAQALARQTADMLKKADIVLSDLTERIQADGFQPSQLVRLQALMQRQVLEQPELHGLFIYDARGDWLVSSFANPPNAVNSANHAYFRQHIELPFGDDLYIGAPIISRTTGTWIIPLSRRVEDTQGRFLGVAMASLSINFLQGFYATFDIGQSGLIDLVRNDGTVLLRSPVDEKTLGTSVENGEIFGRLLEQGPVGTAKFSSIIDGVERLFSYRSVTSYPIVVVTAQAEDEILQDWRQESLRQILMVGGLALLLGLFGFYLIRLIKAGQKTQIELLATRDALRAFNERLERQAMEDVLTGLANRRRFMRELESEYLRARRDQTSLALVIFDVDFFKQYNDRYGHAAGDEALRMVADAIAQGQRRPADLAVRYGGEEFCLLLPNTDAEGAMLLANQVRLALAARAVEHHDSPGGYLTLSAGVDVCEPYRLDSGGEALIRNADLALYAAKANGRNRVERFAG